MSDAPKASPLRAFMDIRKEERPLSLLMFVYFYLVITTFWILKPIKKGLFVRYYEDNAFDIFGLSLRAAQVELLAKVANMFVAFFAVVVFSWLSRVLRREQLTYAFSGFFAVTFVAFTWILSDPVAVSVWAFYLYGDLYSTLMVATFFAFLNDAVPPNAARRIYGLIVLGGVCGGVTGPAVSKFFAAESKSVALWVCVVIAAVVVVVARFAGARVLTHDEAPESRVGDEATNENPALAGARLVARSRYLLSIVAIVGLYEIVSTIMDFQFTATVSHYLDGEEIGKQFATVFMITNIVSMFVQIFVTGFVMSRYRMTVALAILPIAVLFGSAAYLALPILWMGSMLNTVDNGFSYSVNQSAKEALYTPTTPEEKYRAKAFIDMFVQRFAKAIAVGVSLLITTVFSDYSSVRYLSLVIVVVIGIWLIAARYAGRQFHELSEGKT